MQTSLTLALVGFGVAGYLRAAHTATPPPECSNRTAETGEPCGDGNTTDGDGCSASCTEDTPPPARCGDGVVNSGEQCDDGNTTSGDGCSSTCKVEMLPPSCDDWYVDEECNADDMVIGDHCSSACSLAGRSH